uniref:Uncharacterized protein n=1 Tax=Panagrolaimus sp. PS1159 TaxID=55785 RepID=A0AC35GQ70_9BILA
MSSFLNAAKLPGIWTNYDYVNAALISAIPISVGLAELGSAAHGGHLRKFFDRSTKPQWASKNAAVHATACFLTLTPLGYATYRVIKNSAGLLSNQAKAAIGIYGIHAILSAGFGNEVRKGNHSKVALVKAGIAAASIGFALAYRNIDETAFWLSVPHVIWSIFSAVYHFDMYQLNEDGHKF